MFVLVAVVVSVVGVAVAVSVNAVLIDVGSDVIAIAIGVNDVADVVVECVDTVCVAAVVIGVDVVVCHCFVLVGIIFVSVSTVFETLLYGIDDGVVVSFIIFDIIVLSEFNVAAVGAEFTVAVSLAPVEPPTVVVPVSVVSLVGIGNVGSANKQHCCRIGINASLKARTRMQTSTHI